MGCKTLRARVPLAVLAAVAAVSAFTAVPAAQAATGSTVTTNFTYAYGSPALTVDGSNLVPPDGTAVTLDLAGLVKSYEAAGYTPAQLSADVADIETALEGNGLNIPAGDFSDTGSASTSLTLYAVADQTAGTFEVSGTKGGVPVAWPSQLTVDTDTATGGTIAKSPYVLGAAPNTGAGSVTWTQGTAPAQTAPERPHVYAGHIVTLGSTRAVVGWTEGTGVTCEQVRIWGYGFSTVTGSPHVGFTCDTGHPGVNEGYLWGLAAGHTYALEVVPASGTYGDNTALPDAQAGWIDLVTTR